MVTKDERQPENEEQVTHFVFVILAGIPTISLLDTLTCYPRLDNPNGTEHRKRRRKVKLDG